MNRTLPVCGNRSNPPISGIRRFSALLAAVFALVAPLDGATAQESVHFPSLDADIAGGAPTVIEAKLYRPAGHGPFPAVIGLHGCGGRDTREGRVSARFRVWAERFVAQGFVVLLPDSFGPRGHSEVCTQRPQAITVALHRPRDAQGALAWLAGQPYARADRVMLVGWSHGGGGTLAALDTGRRAVPRPPSGAQFRAAVAFYPGCRLAEGRGDWRTPIPLLVLNGEADDWTPVEPCYALLERTRRQGLPVELKTYPGAHHAFDEPQGKVRQRSDVGSKQGGTVTLGPDPAARSDAYERVAAFLLKYAMP